MTDDARPKFCTNCGAPAEGSRFCTRCGAPLAAPQADAGTAPQPTTQPTEHTAPQHAAAPPPQRRSRKSVAALLGLVIVPLVLCLGAVACAGFLGLVPGLSRVLGTNQPRDLGVELSVEQAYAGAERILIPTSSSDLEAILADPESAKRFDAKLTGDETSSLLLLGQDGIPDWPLRVVQIRFNPDGTAEASGLLRTPLAEAFLTRQLGVPAEDVAAASSAVAVVGEVPFYIAGDASVVDNHVSLTVSELELGRVTVPGSWYQGNEHVATGYIDSALARNGFHVESLEIADGTVTLNGTRPLAGLGPWLKMVQSE